MRSMFTIIGVAVVCFGSGFAVGRGTTMTLQHELRATLELSQEREQRILELTGSCVAAREETRRCHAGTAQLTSDVDEAQRSLADCRAELRASQEARTALEEATPTRCSPYTVIDVVGATDTRLDCTAPTYPGEVRRVGVPYQGTHQFPVQFIYEQDCVCPDER